MSRSLYFLTLSLVTISFFSCRRPKVVSEPCPVLPVSCEIREIDFTYLTSKAKLHYKDNQTEQKTNANIRMKKDSAIWISINAAAGFEAFRILILTDSVHILDRLSNHYSVKDYDELSRSLGVELNFSMLQGLILGNSMLPRDQEDEVIQEDTSYCTYIQKRGSVIVTNYVKSCWSKIEKVEMTDGANSLTINYLKFVPLGNFTFASENDIQLNYNDNNSSQKVEITIEHNKTEFPDKDISFPFNVPNRFERK